MAEWIAHWSHNLLVGGSNPLQVKFFFSKKIKNIYFYMTQKNSNQISLFSYIQGQRNTFFLGGAHCFFPFENATFLKKIVK